MGISVIEAREVSDKLLDAAAEVDAYLDKHWKTISRENYEALAEFQRSLIRAGSILTTVAVGISIENTLHVEASIEGPWPDQSGPVD